MKHCPECGEAMRLGMGQWVHAAPGKCRVVTLRATPEEVAAAVRPAPRHGAGRGRGPAARRRFDYLSTEGTPPTGA